MEHHSRGRMQRCHPQLIVVLGHPLPAPLPPPDLNIHRQKQLFFSVGCNFKLKKKKKKKKDVKAALPKSLNYK